MKRQQDNELAPRNKRRSSSYISREEYDGYDYMHGGAEGDRRERRPMLGRDGKVPRDQRDRERRDFESKLDTSHLIKRHKSDRADHAQRPDRSSAVEYKTLVLSNIHEQAPDHMVCEVIEDEYKRFGEFNVKLVYNGDHRVAYVNFRYPENARSAKHSRAKLILYDRPMAIDSVGPKRSYSTASDISEGYANRDPYFQPGMVPVRGGGGNRRVRQDSFGSEGHRSDFQQYENRQQSRVQGNSDGGRERFPHHLHHIPPEDDDKATRTLFVGNLDPTTLDEDLLAIFQRYGVVEDIDIKRPPKVQGNAYAFVKFANLDMAHRAKVDMSGELIGNFQCKIGYGKAHPSTCLWVGGLGPWIRPESLEREFDRFGVIHRIEWPQGKNYAYILYDNTDAAQAACQQMRGVPLGGPDRRLRIDFTDPAHIDRPPTKNAPLRKEEPRDSVVLGAEVFEHRDTSDNWHSKGGPMNHARGGSRKHLGSGDGFHGADAAFVGEYAERGGRHEVSDQMGDPADRRKGSRRGPDNWSNGAGHGPDWQQENAAHQGARRERPAGNRPGNASGGAGNRTTHGENGSMPHLGNPQSVESIVNLAKCLPVVWSGALILKNNAFATRMHLLSGDVAVVDNLMRDPTSTEMPVLRIAQRLRLDQPMLEDVGKRILSTTHGGGHSVLLAMPGSTEAVEESNTNVKQGPLRNLMSYLKQKEAAGVVALPPNTNGKDNKDGGKLYAFPPCAFSHTFLAKHAPKLGNDPAKDDHLVVVVVKNE